MPRPYVRGSASAEVASTRRQHGSLRAGRSTRPSRNESERIEPVAPVLAGVQVEALLGEAPHARLDLAGDRSAVRGVVRNLVERVAHDVDVRVGAALHAHAIAALHVLVAVPDGVELSSASQRGALLAGGLLMLVGVLKVLAYGFSVSGLLAFASGAALVSYGLTRR